MFSQESDTHTHNVKTIAPISDTVYKDKAYFPLVTTCLAAAFRVLNWVLVSALIDTMSNDPKRIKRIILYKYNEAEIKITVLQKGSTGYRYSCTDWPLQELSTLT